MKPGLVTGIAVGLCAMAGAAVAQDVITQRRDGMKNMGRQMEAIKAVTDARGDTRPLVERIDTMLALYTGLPALFPAGSGTGETRALPAIWSDRAGFEQMDSTMVTRLGVLRAAAAAGDVAATTAAFGQVGATCAACHRTIAAPPAERRPGCAGWRIHQCYPAPPSRVTAHTATAATASSATASTAGPCRGARAAESGSRFTPVTIGRTRSCPFSSR